MKFQMRCLVFLKVISLVQLCSGSENLSGDLALSMQWNAERLIEKIITQIQDYYYQIKAESKCIPDNICDDLIETLKKAVDCVHTNEKSYIKGKITERAHSKNFLQCFANAKKEVKNLLESINPNEDHCPENMTERTYKINVTTTYTKTFHINIKNGVDVKYEKIEFFRGCGGNKTVTTNNNVIKKYEITTDSITTTDTYKNSTTTSFDIGKTTENNE